MWEWRSCCDTLSVQVDMARLVGGSVQSLCRLSAGLWATNCSSSTCCLIVIWEYSWVLYGQSSLNNLFLLWQQLLSSKPTRNYVQGNVLLVCPQFIYWDKWAWHDCLRCQERHLGYRRVYSGMTATPPENNPAFKVVSHFMLARRVAIRELHVNTPCCPPHLCHYVWVQSFHFPRHVATEQQNDRNWQGWFPG